MTTEYYTVHFPKSKRKLKKIIRKLYTYKKYGDGSYPCGFREDVIVSLYPLLLIKYGEVDSNIIFEYMYKRIPYITIDHGQNLYSYRICYV